MLSVLVQVDDGDCSGSWGHRDDLRSGSLGRSSRDDMALPLLRGHTPPPPLGLSTVEEPSSPLGRIPDFLGLAQKTFFSLHGCIMKNLRSEHNSKKKKRGEKKKRGKEGCGCITRGFRTKLTLKKPGRRGYLREGMDGKIHDPPNAILLLIRRFTYFDSYIYKKREEKRVQTHKR